MRSIEKREKEDKEQIGKKERSSKGKGGGGGGRGQQGGEGCMPLIRSAHIKRITESRETVPYPFPERRTRLYDKKRKWQSEDLTPYIQQYCKFTHKC